MQMYGNTFITYEKNFWCQLANLLLLNAVMSYCQFLIFQTIEPSNKRYLLAIDASESMQYGGILGCSHVSPLVASAAMALILARKEQSPKIIALSNSIQDLSVSSSSLLADVCSQLHQVCVVTHSFGHLCYSC